MGDHPKDAALSNGGNHWLWRGEKKEMGETEEEDKERREMDSGREGESHPCVRVLNSGFNQPQAGVGEGIYTKSVTFPCYSPLKLQQNNTLTLC